MLNDEQLLELIISEFYENKQKLDIYKKDTDDENKRIKQLMSELNITEFATQNGLIAKTITQKKESFMEDKLLLKLKELGVTSPIKTIEIIDYDELENVIYNNQLNASELTDCKECKEVIMLKVTKKKGE